MSENLVSTVEPATSYDQPVRRRKEDMRKRVLELAGSLEVAIGALVFLMVLVFVCTLDQVNLGTFAAVDKYFRSFFVWKEIGPVNLPIFPGGGAVGSVLLINLVATMAARFRADMKKAGIWLIHTGLIILVFGEFVTGGFAVETQVAFREGETVDFTVSPRQDEFVVIERGSQGDTVHALDVACFHDGKVLGSKAWPFTLEIDTWHGNAQAGRRPADPSLPDPVADRGVGPSMVLRPLPRVSRDDQRNQPAAFLRLKGAGKADGTWFVWSGLGSEQSFEADGRTWAIALRPTRRYLPFELTLEDFQHKRYPGTDIPKDFTSIVRLISDKTGEDRKVRIYMNNPLRYEGRTFYQASFGENDTLSVLQVVENPGWLLPYISFVLMAIGLGVHFAISLSRFKPASKEAAG